MVAPKVEGRPPLPSLRELAESWDGAASVADAPRSARADRIAVIAANAAEVLAQLDADRQPFAVAYGAPDDLPASEEAWVVVIAEQLLGSDVAGCLRRLRGRAPAAKFVFLASGAAPERARELAPFGAVVFDNADARFDLAVRHASSLATMAAEMRRLRQTGRFPLPGSPPRDGE